MELEAPFTAAARSPDLEPPAVALFLLDKPVEPRHRLAQPRRHRLALDRAGLEQRLRKDLREELLVTPEIRIEPFGTLERTTFKAKRILDKRPK